MKLETRRRISLLLTPLLMLQLAACSYWQGRPGQFREILTDPEVGQVRLTANDGEEIVARVAEVRGDSIYGTRGTTGPLTCEQASPLCNLQMPISEVGYVEVRGFSAIRTVAIVLVPVTAIALAVLVEDQCRPSQETC